jgi:hypothetical protein
MSKIILTDEGCTKLTVLEQYMPEQGSIVYDFGGLLAERVRPNTLPEGFLLAGLLVLYDASVGVDGFSGKPINSKLTGLPERMYMLLEIMIPKIAVAVASDEFAKEVRTLFREYESR